MKRRAVFALAMVLAVLTISVSCVKEFNEYDLLPTFSVKGHTYRVAPDPHTDCDQYMSWDAANTYCQNLTLYGYSDWRMPTIEELESMYYNRNSIGGFIDIYETQGGTYINGYYERVNVKWYPCYYSSSASDSANNNHYIIIWDGKGTKEIGYDAGYYYNNDVYYYVSHYCCHVRPIRIEK